MCVGVNGRNESTHQAFAWLCAGKKSHGIIDCKISGEKRINPDNRRLSGQSGIYCIDSRQLN